MEQTTGNEKRHCQNEVSRQIKYLENTVILLHVGHMESERVKQNSFFIKKINCVVLASNQI